MARQVLGIFLSSTSEDLREYRNTVTNVLTGLGQFAVRMESFGARPNKPLDVCREEVIGCDALIVLVGHRYGWVPSKDEGGDGRRSITWHEVQWALDGNLPVYAFMIDPHASWSGLREQDGLADARTQAQSLVVWRAVRGLRDFRGFLESRTTRALFASADQLGSLVATSLFPWLLRRAAPMHAATPRDRSPVSVIPSDSRSQLVRSRNDLRHEQIYWQEQIHAPSARELVGDRPGIRVAIIAGLPRSKHPALTGVEITPLSLETSVAASQPDDYTTALAALIAGSGDDGFAGVAPGTRLLAISVLNEHNTATNAGIATALDRAVLGGARVICLSLGSPEPSPVVDEAIAGAVRAGVVVVAAAGNGGDDAPEFPAASAGVLAVGAVDHHGCPTLWTTRGTWVHVMAPGYEMALPAGENGYAPSRGTAWSCAIASGVVALLFQVDSNSTLTPAEITGLLIATGQPRVGSDSAGGTIIDAHGAVRRAIELVGNRSAEQVTT